MSLDRPSRQHSKQLFQRCPLDGPLGGRRGKQPEPTPRRKDNLHKTLYQALLNGPPRYLYSNSPELGVLDRSQAASRNSFSSFPRAMAEQVRPKRRISLKETFKNLVPEFSEGDLAWLQVAAAVLVGLVTLVLLWRLLRGSSKRRGVLLMGLCESGKTQLFSQLCHGVDVISVTSVKESSGTYTAGKKSLTLYDLPGHERIRYAMFEKIKKFARGIIFVLDSGSIQKDVRDVAEFLYSVLCDGTVQSGVSRVLVVCNKQDLTLARAAPLIQKTLEKEMNLLRVTKASQLQSVGEGSNNNSFLGKQGQDFEFSHLGSMKVEFVEAVAKGGENLTPITSWLQQLA